METLSSLNATKFTSFVLNLKEKNAWYSQKLCNYSSHEASALTLGESKILKYGLNFPLRSGIDPKSANDYSTLSSIYYPICEETTNFLYEELLICDGVCLVSNGPLIGPCILKGIYRPQLSYGTGNGIQNALRATFSTPDSEPETYYALSEKAGISFYKKDTSETHIVYMPEFNIEKLYVTSYGLIVVPSLSTVSQVDDDDIEQTPEHFLYILTNPFKQVSQIFLKNTLDPGFSKYECKSEKLLWSENDLCIFWSLKNDKIIIRRLYAFDKKDIFQNPEINTTRSIINTTQTEESFRSGNHSLYSLSRSHYKGMKVNKDGSNLHFWPTLDFSNTSTNNGLAVGFYPPHICVYDDGEYYMKTLFQIDIPKGNWKYEPRKFQMMSLEKNLNSGKRISLFLLLKNNLYVYGIELDSGTQLSQYTTKYVQDFVVPDKHLFDEKNPFIIILETSKKLKIGWLDNKFNLICSSTIQFSFEKELSIKSVDFVFFGNQIVCSLTDQTEKVLIEIPNYNDNGLINLAVESFNKEVPSQILTKIISRYLLTIKSQHTPSHERWSNFIKGVLNVVLDEPVNNRCVVGNQIYSIIKSLRENLKSSKSCLIFIDNLKTLQKTLETFLIQNLSKEEILTPSYPYHFKKFGELLLCENPEKDSDFKSLPEVLKILLLKPDSLESLKKLVELKSIKEKFSPLIEILIADVLQRNKTKAKFSWPEPVLKAVGRRDYLSGINPHKIQVINDKISDIFSPNRQRDEEDEITWSQNVLNMRIFSEDRRLEEVCRLLDSSSPLIIDTDSRVDISDHDQAEEQEKHLLQMVQITFSAALGRAAFTLRTEEKNYSNLTSVIQIPKMCLSGKCAIKGTTVELNDSDLPCSYTAWPSFHNAVAAALSVHFNEPPADAWFAYNKSQTHEGPEQAGIILGFGLNGILSSMPSTLRHDHLSKENSFTTMSMLLGLSANLAGTGDISTWKLLSLHIGAMLPSCTTELEIPRFATLVAPFSLGLLFLGTHNSHIAKVLLGEISKRYSPLSVFGGGAVNASASNVNVIEVSGIVADRESHSLCAGFGLGFVNLGKGRLKNDVGEEGFDGILRRFVVGGPKPAEYIDDEDDMYNQFGQNMPSLWEEYRCCHIEEGDNVNVDVTTPSAIIAVALIYLRTGNEAVLKWLSPPTTLHLLDGVRPDLLMLRALAIILVHDEIETPEIDWLEDNILPQALLKSALKKPDKNSRIDIESINQAWANIICGFCLGLGIRFAGTSNSTVKNTLWHYIDLLLNISTTESEYFPKNFLESVVCNLLISLSLLLAGTGDIPTLRLCRYLQAKIAATQITSTSNTYGLELCISMATGILFLGGGRYSLSNDDKSIAVLLASVFPKWPINANDNRYHLQALRHLYVLAAQPRLILTKPMPHNSKLKFTIEFLDGNKTEYLAPVLIPPFHLLKNVKLNDPEFIPIEFNLPQDLPYLKKIVESDGILELIPKPKITMKHGFLRKMSWREHYAYHGTFSTERISGKASEINSLNLISRMAEWVGLSKAIPSLLYLAYGNEQNEDWIWQVRSLYRWVFVSHSKGIQSCIPIELLSNIAARYKNGLNIFQTDFKFNSEAEKVDELKKDKSTIVKDEPME